MIDERMRTGKGIDHENRRLGDHAQRTVLAPMGSVTRRASGRAAPALHRSSSRGTELRRRWSRPWIAGGAVPVSRESRDGPGAVASGVNQARSARRTTTSPGPASVLGRASQPPRRATWIARPAGPMRPEPEVRSPTRAQSPPTAQSKAERASRATPVAEICGVGSAGPAFILGGVSAPAVTARGASSAAGSTDVATCRTRAGSAAEPASVLALVLLGLVYASTNS